MKFTVDKTVLLDACTKCQKVIASKNTMPILDTIKFKIVHDGYTILAATDLQTYLETTINVKRDDGEITLFCLASKLLLDTLSKLPNEEIEFDISDVQCIITTSNGEFTMPVYDANDFPLKQSNPMPTFEAVLVPTDELFSVVHSVIFAVSKEDLRPSMCGINLVKKDHIYFNATDGHRLSSSILDVASTGDIDISIPVKPLSNLNTFFGDKINVQYGSFLSLSDDSTSVQITLIKEQFPNIFAVMPQVKDDDIVLKAKKFDLMKLLKLATLYGNKQSGLIVFTLKEGELIIDAQDLDFSVSATERYSPNFINGEIKIGFNGNILLDCVKNLNCDTVEFRFTEASRAALILDADRIANQKMLIMPLMINND
jgi:DNA polymerase-3 subunit beta